VPTASKAWYGGLLHVLQNPGFWFYFPVLQTFNRYQRAIIGPLWLVIPTSLFVLLLGSLYSVVLETDIRPYMMHLAVGYVTWGFITTSLVASSQAVKGNKNFLLQGNIKAIHIILKGITNNFITTIHAAVIIPLVMIYFSFFDINILGILVAAIVFLFNALTFGIIFALLGARFKDLTHLIQSVMRVLFFATPIIWLPGSVRGEIVGVFLYLNPFYYFLEVAREPFFGNWAAPEAYIFVGVASVLSFIVSDVLYRRLSRYYLLWV